MDYYHGNMTPGLTEFLPFEGKENNLKRPCLFDFKLAACYSLHPEQKSAVYITLLGYPGGWCSGLSGNVSRRA